MKICNKINPSEASRTSCEINDSNDLLMLDGETPLLVVTLFDCKFYPLSSTVAVKIFFWIVVNPFQICV